MTGAQVLLSSIDWTLAGAALFVLLPDAPGLTLPRFLGIFLLAQVAGLGSHVPAGLGVFETAMVMLLAPWLPGDAVLGSVLAYRIVYYLLPMAVAVPLFVGFEARERSGALRRAGSALGTWIPELIPRALAATTFSAGVILLLSGATPAAPGRFEVLDRLLPLPVMEISHLLGSVIGVALLLLARSVQQRVDAAYVLTLSLLVGGAVASLLKGLDWEEALVLSAMAAALLPCRRYFYRRSALLTQSFSPAWVAGIALIFVATFFVLLLAHREVDYSHDLWWQFTADADTPRSLRAVAAGGDPPPPYAGQGSCYIEFGSGRVARVDIDFLSGPERTGVFQAPSAELIAEKQHFGASRRARWFAAGS
jgi:phosphatidylglycerol lysyltransferase